ncbi:unnamed protein product [Gongylonema pulchrum]|uniref:Ovule protein n=1 Tax=Gongylonema pulchrum TaxID=637853 RepID=A0A183CY72_9BILA|nr:unnamed protein product [Gongylonema pulchrum]
MILSVYHRNELQKQKKKGRDCLLRVLMIFKRFNIVFKSAELKCFFRDKESLMLNVRDIEARIAEASSPMVIIRHPTIPKEFSDDTKENKASFIMSTKKSELSVWDTDARSLGRSLLSAFKHSTEEDDASSRSKQTSFDENQLSEAPAIR